MINNKLKKTLSKFFSRSVDILSSRVIIENILFLKVLVASKYKVITNPLVVGLHQEGKRLTPQRIKVLNLFQSIGSGNHLSAEEVHGELISTNSKVSLATVYRTLRLLVKMGFLHELELSDGGHRYELFSNDFPDHHHLICIRCGRTEEFENDKVLEAGKIAAREFGFKLIETAFNVRAICPNCF